jgi:hypothetical protein
MTISKVKQKQNAGHVKHRHYNLNPNKSQKQKHACKREFN